jgi:hypothetical protein
MITKNSIFYLFIGRKIYGLLCLALLSIGCAQAPKINAAARQEAETLANDATALYKKSQQAISFDNKYSWKMAVDMDDAKTRNGKFLSAAKDLESARDKFLQASTKMTEAMNGQTRLDSDEAGNLSRMSRAYKLWSDMAELERKTLQDASVMTDPKALDQKLTEAQENRDKMNKDLMEIIRLAG